MTSLEILGCRLDVLDLDAATEAMVEFARDGGGHQVVTLGTEMVVYAQNDERFRAIVNASALSLCDTVGLLTVARQRGARLNARVTGVELLERLCARAARDGFSIYLLGSAPGVASAAAARLIERYPGLHVAGVRDGYFQSAQGRAIAAEIRASGARALFVGLGSPRQEFWLAEYLSACGVGVGMGIGGSLDVIAGKVERAPEAWRRRNLEWLYRLVTQPGRWRRQLALPYFVWLIVLEGLRLRKKRTT